MYRRGTTRNFLHSFPLSGALVVQSYWAWNVCSLGRFESERASEDGVGRDLPPFVVSLCLLVFVFIFYQCLSLGEAKLGGFQTGGFPTFFGKVQIVSRTLSGLFLVGALNRPRKRKGTNRENPRTIPEQIGKIPEKSGKSQQGQKRTKKEGQVQIGKHPRLKPPRLAALDFRVGPRRWQTAALDRHLPKSRSNPACIGRLSNFQN